jgi:hypothetical protein
MFSGRYYKPMTILNDDSRLVNKLEASLTDDSRVVIYDRHMFIVQATGHNHRDMLNSVKFEIEKYNSRAGLSVLSLV